MKAKKIICIALIAICIFCLCSCKDESSLKDQEYSEDIKSQISDAIGYPNLSNFFEYAQLKEIYELRDDPNLICYWYTKNEYSGKWVYEGKCIGYGIPYSASITSPDKAMYSNGGVVVSQSEPNGIYTNGLSTSATWILAINAEGDIKPEYVEQSIRVSQEKISPNKCEDWSLPSDY